MVGIEEIVAIGVHKISYLRKAFVVALVYLLALIVGGFFILPGVLNVDNYDFPNVVEFLLKLCAAVAVFIVAVSSIIIPAYVLSQRSKRTINTPSSLATLTMLIGFIAIFLNGLYVKLRTCPVGGSDEWYCRIEGKSYIGMLVVTMFLASLVGGSAWLYSRFSRTNHTDTK